MIRTILELMIERSLDEGKKPSPWLRWVARRDQRLQQHNQQVLELDRQLRSSAIIRRQQLEVGTAVGTRPAVYRRQVHETRPIIRPAWLAAAAALLVAGIVLFDRHLERQTKAEQVRLVTTQLAAMPNDMLSLFSEVAQVPQGYSPLTQLSLPAVDPWSDIPRGAQGQLKQSFQTWGSQLSDIGERVYERFNFRADAELN